MDNSEYFNGICPPLISIVMTAYNAERYIKASVFAALKQNYPNYEVILVNDGSTDTTHSICQEIKDSKFKYFKRERNGRSCALNEAIGLADGKYIAINDADDLSFSTRLSYAGRFLDNNHDVALVATAYSTAWKFMNSITSFDQLDENLTDKPKPTIIDPHRLYRSNPLVHSTVVYKRDLWSLVGGYDERLDVCIDYDFYFRIMQHGKIVVLPYPTVQYYKNPSSYFKTVDLISYIAAILRIKRRARDLLNMPWWVVAYDLAFILTQGRRLVTIPWQSRVRGL